MTTFTITCPPTVAASTERATAYTTSYVSEDLTPFGWPDNPQLGNETTSAVSVFVTDRSGNKYASGSFLVTAQGGGGDGAPYTDNTNNTVAITQSWNGARTQENSDGQTTATAEASVISNITTTESQITVVATVTQPTQTVIVTGTTTSTVRSSISLTLPTTRTTLANATTTDIQERATTTIGTTETAETITAYGGTTGTRATATVVVLDANEALYSITQRPSGEVPFSDVVSLIAATQTTFSQSFSFREGPVVTYDSSFDEDEGVLFIAPTSQEIEQGQETITTTTANNFTITTLFPVNCWPPTDALQAAVTRITTTEEIRETSSRSYTGPTIATTVSDLFFREISLSSVVYQQSYTSTKETTTIEEFASVTSFTSSTETIYDEEFVSKTSTGQSATLAKTFEIAERIGGNFALGSNLQHSAGLSFRGAYALPRNFSEVGTVVGPVGITITNAPNGWWQASRTAHLPRVETSSSTSSASQTVRWSANGVGVTVTTLAESGTSTTSTSQSGSWTTAGSATTSLALRQNVINPGGRQAASTLGTGFRGPGLFYTSGPNGTGTQSFSGFATFEIGTSTPRVALSRMPYATALNDFNIQERFTTQRNFTNIIGEDDLVL
jgi:hypothetical protein